MGLLFVESIIQDRYVSESTDINVTFSLNKHTGCFLKLNGIDITFLRSTLIYVFSSAELLHQDFDIWSLLTVDLKNVRIFSSILKLQLLRLFGILFFCSF